MKKKTLQLIIQKMVYEGYTFYKLKNKTIMIIAGEASGDIYGAQLAEAIKKKLGHIDLCGMGSHAMRSAGVDILVEANTLSVMGLTEVISKIPTVIASINCVKRAMIKLFPALIILIDFPDFNLHIAAFAKRLNIPVLYYISPKLWAWRKSRLKKIKQFIDKMAVILPFEEIFYKKNSVPVNFVGHPLLDRIDDKKDSYPKTIEKAGVNNKDPVVGLLPGSRDKEVSRLLPIMLKAARLIKKEVVSTKFIVSLAHSVNSRALNKIVEKHSGSLDVLISTQPVEQLFTESDYLVAASGTVTLEAALCGIPTVIVYKLSTMSYLVGKIMINVKHIGLANLILDRRLIPELVQWEVTPNNISKIVVPALKDFKILNKIKDQLLNVRKYLGKPGASERVASLAVNMLRKQHKNFC